MEKDLIVTKSIEINASSQKVWDALVNPKIIKRYLFGTETISDWKIGSTIIFQGDYQGEKYKDKGNILDIKSEQLLQYNYWSGFSGLEDDPNNYSIVTYKLEDLNGKTKLTLTQKGFANLQAQQHSEKAWMQILEKIAELTEEK